MKTAVTASLFVFFAITTALLAAGFVTADRSSAPAAVTNVVGGSNTAIPSADAVATLTTEELAKHDTPQSCWLLISGKLYDVTPFITDHPGGAGEILPNCGKDATAAYATRGGTGKHSGVAQSMLADYYIGDLGAAVPVQTAQPAATTTGKTTAAASPKPPVTTKPSATVKPPAAPPAPATPTASLTKAELAKHGTPSNCWLLIRGKLYDVTEYVPFHPGGQSRITTRCGTDATTAFDTQDGEGTHSASARTLLASYYVGDLGAAAAPTAVPESPVTTDTTLPAVTLVTPASGALLSGSVTLQATASDASGIGSVQFLMDGQSLITLTAAPYSFPLSTTAYGNGSHTVAVRAVDKNGNVGSATANVTISNQTNPPPQSGATLSAATVAAHASAGNCWLIINGGVYDVTQYIPFHPGGQSQIVPRCGTDATTAFETRGGTETHSTSARTLLANYFLGNLGTQTSDPGTTPPTTTDTTPPAVTLITPASGALLSSSVTLQATASDASGVASVQFLLNGQSLATDSASPYTTSLNTTQYGNGSYTVTARATDTKGNTASASANVTISNQAAPPQTGTTYTAADVAAHASSGNCWIIVSNKVYNVTQYIPFHPGGQNRIIQTCGTDATTAFATQGGNGSHSTNAYSLLASYYLGDLAGAPGGGGGSPTSTPPSSGSTYTVTVTSNGTISPASLTIAAGSIVRFQYTNPGDEVVLTFSPKPPNDIKLDHEAVLKTYTFTQTGTYTYRPKEGGGTNATIVVQ